MSQFVTISYRDARDADSAVRQLFDSGYSPSETSVIMTDRTRRSYIGNVNATPIAEIVAAPGVSSKTMSIDEVDDVGTPISIGGPLSRDVERGTRESNRLIELIESLGVSELDAKAAARDVGRGGVFIAMAVPDDDVASVRRVINDRGTFAASAPRR